MRISTLDVGGPYAQVMGPSRESTDKIYTCGHRHGEHQRWCVSRIMTDLACRAYRRPVTPAEIEKLRRAGRTPRKRKRTPSTKGWRSGSRRILVSPDFLFRIERDHAAGPDVTSYPISQYELATRLSYFLWASMPDAELRRAADAGTLRDPQVLAAQVRRMLRDPEGRARSRRISADSGSSSAPSSR